MQFIIHCDQGCSALVVRELKTIHGICETEFSHLEKQNTFVTCSLQNNTKLVKALVRMQTAVQIGLIVGRGTEQESITQAKNFDWKAIYANNGTFALKGPEEFIDPLATTLKEKKFTVNLKAPDNLVRITRQEHEGTWIISVDMDTQPLVKRDYKVFNNPASLRSTVAAAALMAAKYTPGKTLTDPFCGGGTIPIEAALFDLKQGPRKELLKEMNCFAWPIFIDKKEELLKQEKKVSSHVRGFDHNITAVKSAQKNASIAQVSPQFTRYEAQYLAHTCEEVDHIITQPPRFSEKDFKGKLSKILGEFAENVKEVLNENGTLTIITNDVEQLCEAIPFENPTVYDIAMGKMPMAIVVWERTYM